MNRHMIPLVIFVALIGLMWVGLSLNPRELPSPLIGKEAPKFEVVTLHDQQRTISNEMFKGKVTVFNVFASWCVACRSEHHLLLQLQRRGVNLVGLNYKDKRGDALVYLNQLGGNPYTVIGHDFDGNVGIEWGVYGTPETFVIDRNGVIRYKQTGPMHPQMIENELMPLLRTLEREV
ncbi:MAG: cytochrome c biogenesis protein CcmG, thiol:disulfide interchange protein DsbE [Thiomicrorhabdus sp.]|nr:MAG: cytochrome c biogenesis protein CcmG, thiol:disulfide interchange protein DsbE [Thiomicrorhabdus sp.]